MSTTCYRLCQGSGRAQHCGFTTARDCIVRQLRSELAALPTAALAVIREGRPVDRSPTMEKLFSLVTSEEAERDAFWASVQKAADVVASWPAWKRGDAGEDER